MRRREDEQRTADSVRKRRYSGGRYERGAETSSRVPERTRGIDHANMDFDQELDDVDDIEETTGAHRQEMTAGDDLAEQTDAEAEPDAYAGSNLDEASMEELYSIADELGIDDYNEMDRDELVREIRGQI